MFVDLQKQIILIFQMKISVPRKILYMLVLATLLIIAALLADKLFQKGNTIPDIKVEEFRKVLFQKDAELDQFLDTLTAQTRYKSIKDLIRYHYPDFRDNLNNKGFAVFIYENDSLKFWSDNTIPVINKYSGSTFSNKIVFLQNAWYKVLHKTSDNRIIIGLLLIKHKYQYDNEFLKNDYHPDFKIPSTVNISPDSTSSKYQIRGVKNDFLFSLIPSIENGRNTIAEKVSVILFVLGFFIFSFYLIAFFSWADKEKKKPWILLTTLIVCMLLLRYLMIIFTEPTAFYFFSLFDPQYYAQSFFFSSLGDFLINALCLFLIVYIFYKLSIPEKIYPKSKAANITILVLSLIAINGLFVFNHYMFDSLIRNSSISFEIYKIFDLSIFSVIGFLIIALLFASMILVTDKLIVFLRNKVNMMQFFIYFSASVALLLFISFRFEIFTTNLISYFFLIIIVSTLAFLRYRNFHYNYYLLLLIIFLASFYIMYFVISTTYERERDIRKVLVVNLANERDLVAELLILEINPKLKEDKAVKNYLHLPYTNHKEMEDYIQKEYFKGFWNKYNLKTYICTVRDSQFLAPDIKMSHCYSFFGDMIEKYGILIPRTNFYFLDNVNGRINYLGVMKYKIYASNLRVTLYLELASKLVTEELGYPELLLDKKLLKKSNISEYSYAKYRNNQLLSQIGSFHYNLSTESYSPKTDEFNFIDFEGYSHLIYNSDQQNTIILSRPQLRVFDILISFSYIFVFFFILTNLILFGTNFPFRNRNYSFNLQARIQLSMIALLLISMFLVGGSTIYYNTTQYQNKNHENIREKIQSAVKELETEMSNEFELNTDLKDLIHARLTKLSTVFTTDVNLFDTKGNLISTSRPEIFEKGLIGTKINMDAFIELTIHKKAEYIHAENISSLSFQSAYVPLKNNNGRLLAYLNLPYFTKQTALKKELTSFVAAIINIYVLLVLISILIAIFVSNKLIQPLSLIQRKLRDTTFGKKNEQIAYEGKDEIGNLIKEYNRMVEELAQSAQLLAKSERESAWREMAKQIAHEIKNPLTPMKLSIQYLQRVWMNNSSDKEEVMEKVTKTLIEQIDTLSTIATEFSSFAKMPKPKLERLDITDFANTSVQLFSGTENINISVILSHTQPIFIIADKEQILRVFNNLIKNAIQAIPDNKKGIISINIYSNHPTVEIIVTDNGSGIPTNMSEKIFEPNFTTKTSGMGLGLSIVKNIIENIGGTIRYETDISSGTSFIIELPEA